VQRKVEEGVAGPWDDDFVEVWKRVEPSLQLGKSVCVGQGACVQEDVAVWDLGSDAVCVGGAD
jgi:hypothetical protein